MDMDMEYTSDPGGVAVTSRYGVPLASPVIYALVKERQKLI